MQKEKDDRKVQCRKKCRKNTKSAGATCVTTKALVTMDLHGSIGEALADVRVMLVKRGMR